MYSRKSGILIHPISFPSNYGCGDLGHDSRKVIDWIKKAGQRLLQILPLGPTGFGDSPYQSFSAFAGTPYLISFDLLLEKDLLKKKDLEIYPESDNARINYYNLYIYNFKILKIAFSNFNNIKKPGSYSKFCEENDFWLKDYSLYMAIKDSQNGAPWISWPKELNKNLDIKKADDGIRDSIEFYKFIQWEFYEEWQSFKKYAKSSGISIIGDVSIFVAYDSADVWANQDLFLLDSSGNPKVVAGVPPDYFSKTGQLWGNPIYNWNKLKQNNYKWWKERIKHTLELVDIIRIDHFRGFESYWAVPFGNSTAEKGKWVKVPGFDFFNSLKKDYGKKLKEIIIAEDLGIITDAVREMRDHFEFPGMRIFQFANFPSFKEQIEAQMDNKKRSDYSEDIYLPEQYIENCVAYPGTHDNDTLKGWFKYLAFEEQIDLINYLNIKEDCEFNYTVIKLLLDSKANTVIFPIQDVLELPSEHRVNTPGTQNTNNWSWRLRLDMLKDEIAEKLYNLTLNSGRI